MLNLPSWRFVHTKVNNHKSCIYTSEIS